MVRVQPSAGQVPANLLRLSIEFTARIEGPVLPRLALLRPDGKPLAQPFLAQELWSPNGRILTVLLHPGRVKTGLNAREVLGPILVDGDDVTLTLDDHPIRHWHVGPADTSGPQLSAWRLSSVRAASRQALVVTLDDAIDGRDAGYLAIADPHGRRVSGQALLKDGERTWVFTPHAPWRAGEYRLIARGTLEDPAGNRLGGRFETPADAPAAEPADAALAFTVGSTPSLASAHRP
ncbi:hypothetical protein [Variovorax sp. RKNM96]|uniref:hypothetical protein n=1 Tax=Variovorax sp. RKNM96 TaxID=2681552 RepID=UPI001F12497A|nr:hypothetical protein [Variovorax sp. RKNM96]